VQLKLAFASLLENRFTLISTGTTNSFSLVALTKHSIGNSRPSRSLKVKCPQMPPRVEDVYQVETDQLGVVLLTWQVPSYSSEELQQMVELEEEKPKSRKSEDIKTGS